MVIEFNSSVEKGFPKLSTAARCQNDTNKSHQRMKLFFIPEFEIVKNNYFENFNRF